MSRKTNRPILVLCLSLLILAVVFLVWSQKAPEEALLRPSSAAEPETGEESAVGVTRSTEKEGKSLSEEVSPDKEEISTKETDREALSGRSSASQQRRNSFLQENTEVGLSDFASSDLGLALGVEDEENFRSRIEAVNRLPNNLADHEVGMMLDYLGQPVSQAVLPSRQEHALRNDLMNVLRRQENSTEVLVESFLSLLYDEEQDAVMQDYALQHLASYHDRAEEFEKIIIEEELELAASNLSSSLSGTAIHGLNRISPTSEEVEKTLETVVNHSLRETSANHLTQISALQVASQRGYSFSREMATHLILEKETPDSLRLAAIHALGEVGQFSDLAYLQGLSANPFYKPAVKEAYNLLSKQ
ncbi:MAG: hypothetical protein JJT75_07800 [Opitutales bacterium]|nr:hypothetical protein [Opitutales bacterium]